MLEDTQIYNAAIVELIWRAYELVLEWGGKPDSPLASYDEIAQYFATRSKELGGPDSLLAEGLLNRFTVLNSPGLSVTSMQPQVLDILANFSRPSEALEPNNAPVETQIAISIFDELLAPHCPLLTERGSTVIAEMFDKHSGELQALRDKCTFVAQEILDGEPKADRLARIVERHVGRCEDEIRSLVSIDQDTIRATARKVATSGGVWAAVAGVASGLLGGWFPPVVAAAAGLTLICHGGAAALEGSLNRRKAIRKSDWSFIYYLDRANH